MLDLLPGRQHNPLQQQQHPFGLRQMNGMNSAALLQGQPGAPRMQMSANDMNRLRLQQALAARGTSMPMQNMQTPANINRQLELMGLAHQQNQHQPGSVTNLAALRQLQHQQQQQQQQHQQQQPGPGPQMLANMANRMPTHMQNNFMATAGMQQAQEQAPPLNMMSQQQRMQMMSQMQNGAAGNRGAINQIQLRDRANILQASIVELEKRAALAQVQGQGRTDPEYFSEIGKLQNEITAKKSIMLKIAQTLHNVPVPTMGPLVGNAYVFVFSRADDAHTHPRTETTSL